MVLDGLSDYFEKPSTRRKWTVNPVYVKGNVDVIVDFEIDNIVMLIEEPDISTLKKKKKKGRRHITQSRIFTEQHLEYIKEQVGIYEIVYDTVFFHKINRIIVGATDIFIELISLPQYKCINKWVICFYLQLYSSPPWIFPVRATRTNVNRQNEVNISKLSGSVHFRNL